MGTLTVSFDFMKDEVQRDELNFLKASLRLLASGIDTSTFYVTRCFRKRDNALVFAIMSNAGGDRYAIFATICPNDLTEFNDLHAEHSIDA